MAGARGNGPTGGAVEPGGERQARRWSSAEEVGRMVVAGGQRQPAAPNVPAAVLKLIFLAVQR